LRLRALIGDEIRPGGLALTERALTFCRFPRQARIADIGCGWGGTLKLLRAGHGLEAMGVDLSMETLLEASPLPVACATALALPLRSEILDGIFCECALSLLASPEQALTEFHRSLKPGGLLALTDIYLRQPPPGAAETEGPYSSCLAGAVGIDRRLDQMRDCGFEVLMWEDHSRLLAELTAQIVWNRGSLSALFGNPACSSCPPGEPFDIRRGRPGYYLAIARKHEKVNHEQPDS